MNRRIFGGVAIGMAAVLATEFVHEGLEPEVGTDVHVPEEDFSPFSFPSPMMFVASGQYSIPNTLSVNRAFRPTLGGD